VLAARSSGIHGIVYSDDDLPGLVRTLRNLVYNPILRGSEYLRQHAGRLETVTDGGVVLEESFTQLLIYEATGDK
jgi:hypothetical protein